MSDEAKEYIVGTAKPYYPIVRSFTTLEEAEACFAEEIKDNEDETGWHSTTVYIAVVIKKVHMPRKEF